MTEGERGRGGGESGATPDRLAPIADTLRRMLAGERDARVPTSAGGELADIASMVNDLGDLLTRSDALAATDLDAFLGQLLAIARFDFGRRLPTEAGSDGYRAMAMGLNFLTEELEVVVDRLSAAEALYRRAFDTAPIGMALTDLEGTIMAVNPAYAAMLGRSAEELIGQPWRSFTHPDDVDENVEWSESVYRGAEDIVEFEKRYVTGRGDVIWGSVKLALVRDDQDRVLNSLAQVVDITDQKAATEALRLTRDRALQADRLKTEFLRNISHEIRTPMTSVIGMIELVLGTDLVDEQREYLEIARDAGGSLVTLVDDVLSLSKIESGGMVPQLVPMDLERTVHAILDPFAARAETAGLAFEWSIAVEVPRRVISDPVWLGQILTNLVGNAIKFTSEGGVAVRVGGESSSGGGYLIHVSVADSGIGIPQDKVHLIFEPFVQANGSTTRTFGGTGLGLAITQRLTSLLGGSMWVESEAGVGSVFHVRLPVAVLGADAGAMQRRRGRAGVRPGDETTERLGRRRVLIADDSASNRLALVRALQGAGFDVAEAVNGRDAVSMSNAGSFDAILMDIQMPGMDGLEAIAAIRREARGVPTRVPIVAVTAHARETDRELALQAGADAYLSKPYRTERLIETLVGAIDVARRNADS